MQTERVLYGILTIYYFMGPSIRNLPARDRLFLVSTSPSRKATVDHFNQYSISKLLKNQVAFPENVD